MPVTLKVVIETRKLLLVLNINKQGRHSTNHASIVCDSCVVGCGVGCGACSGGSDNVDEIAA